MRAGTVITTQAWDVLHDCKCGLVHIWCACGRLWVLTYQTVGQVVVKVTMPPGVGSDTPFEEHQAQVDVWDAGSDQFAQEPIFCPRPGGKEEDDGWIFTMVYDTLTDCSHLAILNAQDLRAGPVARIKLPHKIPFGE